MPITCAVRPAFADGSGSPQQVGDVFVHLRHPVAGEQVLVLPRDRPFEPHHRIDPRSILRLDAELRVGAVLAAAIGDAVVDHDDLAVVAQIDAAPQRPQQRVADRQSRRRVRTPASFIARQCSERDQARASRVASAIARQATPRAAARFSASTTLSPLLSGSQM